MIYINYFFSVVSLASEILKYIRERDEKLSKEHLCKLNDFKDAVKGGNPDDIKKFFEALALNPPSS